MRIQEPSNSGDALPPALERAATEWFFRRDRGLSDAEQKEFERWLAADRRHVAALAEIESSWSDFGRLDEAVARRPATGSRTPGLAANRMRTIAWLRPLLLAAAAVAVVWDVRIKQSPSADETVTSATYAAASDAVRSVGLPDGSTVQLNAGGAIEVRYTRTGRNVRLIRGEGHFAVAKNPARPFIVNTGAVAVRAVGTAFNVKLGADALEVLVTEGRVKLISPSASVAGSVVPGAGGEPVTLVAGEKAIVPHAVSPTLERVAVIAVAPADVERALAWEKRRLEYADASLEEIAADFNRYNAHKLVIADQALAGRRFGGAFPTNDYEAFVHLLESTFGVVADRRENETVLRLP